MTDQTVIQIGMDAMMLALKLGGPILVVALALGVGVGLFQSVTQLQEPTLSFVPKFLGVGVVLLLSGSWMLAETVSFTQGLFEMLPSMLS